MLQRLAGLEELAGSHEFAARQPTFVRPALAVDEPELAEQLTSLLVPLVPMREYAVATANALLAEHRGDRAAGFREVAGDWKTFGNVLEQKHALAAAARTARS